MNHRRINLFGVPMDALGMSDAVAQLIQWSREPSNTCRYVVTPNVDHVVTLRDMDSFRKVYHDADLVLADGWPVVAASRLVGRSLPERVPGSELVPRFFDAVARDGSRTVYLLGAMPGVAERAAANVHAQWPHIQVVGTYSPPLGFEKNDAENQEILERICQARPDVLIIGLGAPKQELWLHRFRHEIPARVALCVGATIDFLAGEKKRAPHWIQRIGMEWFHRMASEPQRLARRYARDAWIFPRMVWHEWRGTRPSKLSGRA